MKFKKEYTLKSGEKLIIHSAEKRDAKNLAEYDNLIFKETKNFSIGEEDGNMPVESCEGYIEKQNKPRNIYLLAKINNKIIGHVSVSEMSARAREHHRASFGIGVLKQHWGKGVAGLLMVEALTMAKQLGYEQIELEVVKTNKRAYNLYKSFGFVKEGVLKNFFKYGFGDYADCIYMVKFL